MVKGRPLAVLCLPFLKLNIMVRLLLGLLVFLISGLYVIGLLPGDHTPLENVFEKKVVETNHWTTVLVYGVLVVGGFIIAILFCKNYHYNSIKNEKEK